MSYATAYERWAGVGPYYAMFPISFVDRVVQRYTEPRHHILDPFAGRASSIFAGAARGRPSIGIEINPVGWIYGATKLHPAPVAHVQARMRELVQISKEYSTKIVGELDTFFKLCFADNVLRFLQACRVHLDWRNNDVDRTLMALILVDLHGRRDKSFSNQMSQSKAMSPSYSVTWWRKNKYTPPERDIETFLLKKICWRYAKGTPETVDSKVLLGDSCNLLHTLHKQNELNDRKPFQLLLTSPPYLGITDYHRDQWLRRWMLGDHPTAARLSDKYKGAFASQAEFRKLLESVFSQAAELMSNRGVVYVRTDARQATFELTQEVLQTAFPYWREQIIDQPAPRRSQTARFGDTSEKPGERDIVLTAPSAVI